MQDKQKVTLYLPPGIHRQLKIRAAIDIESMSAIVEKAIAFYLKYPEKVEELEAQTFGKSHQVHVCPECDAAMVMQEGQMVSLRHQADVIVDEFPLDVRETVNAKAGSQEEEMLVPC
jgi:plasmid stability protein